MPAGLILPEPREVIWAARLARDAGCEVIMDGVPARAGDRDALLPLAGVLRADAREAQLLTGHHRGG